MATVVEAAGVRLPELGAAAPDAQRRESTPGPSATASAPRSGALGLHKGIGPPGCPRWPDGLRLESTLGDLVPGRCKATNLCEYCARLAAVENAEVLAQDALVNGGPAVWSVLGTRSTIATMGAYKQAREKVTLAVKRRWPDAERATLVEFTTGYGTRAAGKRRPHWNDLWKNVPAEDADELRELLARIWCGHVDATRKAQHVGLVNEVGGLMRYLALHFQKESQQPPKGWRGHRFTTSRGYLSEPMAAARERARDALQLRRELWKLERQVVETNDGQVIPLAQLLDSFEIHELAQRAHYERRELAWSLVRVREVPTDFDADGMPSAWATVTDADLNAAWLADLPPLPVS